MFREYIFNATSSFISIVIPIMQFKLYSLRENAKLLHATLLPTWVIETFSTSVAT